MFLPDVSDLYQKYMVTKINRKCIMGLHSGLIGFMPIFPDFGGKSYVKRRVHPSTMARLLHLWEARALAGLDTLRLKEE